MTAAGFATTSSKPPDYLLEVTPLPIFLYFC